MVIDIQEFLSLRHQLPVVDVRSEGEYQEGHIPNALNIPLLNNTERVAVGTDYKQKGQAEAIKTGMRLVGPRLLEIVEAAENIGNELVVHCWRGGMRSSNFCQFVGMAKIKTHQLKGGYKTYRQLTYEIFKKPFQFIVIGGFTGSGKSEILRALKANDEQVIDLEILAHHKGSSFGGLLQAPQPTTEQFENNLFEELLKLDVNRRVWIEDESIALGKIFLPQDIWKRMGSCPVIEMEVPKEVRVERLVNEYGPADQLKFIEAMERISKKLGGQNFKAAQDFYLSGDLTSTIEILLYYYDKTYNTGLQRKANRIKLRKQWNGVDSNAFAQELIKEVEVSKIESALVV